MNIIDNDKPASQAAFYENRSVKNEAPSVSSKITNSFVSGKMKNFLKSAYEKIKALHIYYSILIFSIARTAPENHYREDEGQLNN